MTRRLLLIYLLAIGALGMVCGAGPLDPSSPGPLGALDPGRARSRPFGVPGTADVSWDTVRLVFITNPAVDHFFATADAAIAAADSVWDLDAENEFAWAMIDEDETNEEADELENPQYYRMSMGDSVVNNYALGDSRSGRHLLVHYPFEEAIPAGSTIISAALHLYSEGVTAMTGRDTTTATLMTTADSLWYTDKGYTYSTYTLANMAFCTYDQQISGLNVQGYPAANTAWATAPSSKNYFWQWGDYSDATGNNTASIADTAERVLEITNCVQAAVNGAVNNGIIFIVNEYGTERLDYTVSFDAPAVSGLNLKIPWIEITYITKKYVAPFPGGADWTFVFSTDDGKPFNVNLADTFAVRNVAYSLFLTAAAPDSGSIPGNTAYISWAQLLNIYEDGMEIGSHSRWHTPGSGLNAHQADGVALNEYWRGRDPAEFTAENQADSLYADADPIWLHIGAAANGYPDSLKTAARFGKSFALPVNKYNPEAIQALVYHGYKGVRTDQASVVTRTDAAGHYLHTIIANERPARADSFAVGFQMSFPRQQRNMIGVPTTHEIASLAGAEADTATTTAAWIEFKVRHASEMLRAQGARVLSTFAHAHKASTSYPDGVDPDEMGVILDTVMARAGRGNMPGAVMTVGAYADWMKANSLAISTPTGWVAAPDTFAYTVDQGVWFKPNGVDNMPIRDLEQPTYPDILSRGHIDTMIVTQDARLGLAYPGPIEYYSWAKEAGMGMVRIDAHWGLLQDGIDSTFTDARIYDNFYDKVATLDSLGLKPYITFVSDNDSFTIPMPEGENKDPANDIPDDWGMWRKFVRRVVETLDDDGTTDVLDLSAAVEWFSIANEWVGIQNQSGGWMGSLWNGTYPEIITYSDTAYAAMNAAYAPSKLVFGGGASPLTLICASADSIYVGAEPYFADYDVSTSGMFLTLKFMRDDMNVGCGTPGEFCAEAVIDSIKYIVAQAACDYHAVHQYGPVEHSAARIGYMEAIGHTNLVVDEGGGPSTLWSVCDTTCCEPDCITYPVATDGSAHFMAAIELNLQTQAQDIPFFLWLGMFEAEQTAGNAEVPLCDGLGNKKPGFFAYKHLALLFEDCTAVDDVAGEPGVYLLTYSGGETAYVGFARSGNTSFTLPIAFDPVECYAITNVVNGAWKKMVPPGRGQIIGLGVLPVVISEKDYTGI